MVQGGTVVNSDEERRSDVHVRDGLVYSVASSIKVHSLRGALKSRKQPLLVLRLSLNNACEHESKKDYAA